MKSENPNFDDARFTKDISKNAKNTSYAIIKTPMLKGNISVLTAEKFAIHRHVTIQLAKIDEEEYGSVNINVQNACFNKLGFMVHDTAL